MRVYRILGSMAIGATIAFGMTQAMSWAVSPQAPKVVRTPRAQIVPLPKGVDDYTTEGLDMTAAQAAALLKRIAKNPGDAVARAKLMAYTEFHREAPHAQKLHDEQVVWFAANLPDSPVLAGGSVHIDNTFNANTYALVKRLFEEARAKQPRSAAILRNYANLVNVAESGLAANLLKRATVLSPNDPVLYERLGFAHYLASTGVFGQRDTAQSALALEAYLKAQSLGGDVSAKFLLEAAFDANRLDVVEGQTKRMLAASPDADTVHAAHTTLGRLALKRGNVEEAKRHLLASAKVDGSPVLGSFGPSMELAKELLEKGERTTVLAYLKATGKFWDDERQVRWTKQAEKGQTPDWD